jgi:hypothetical protein
MPGAPGIHGWPVSLEDVRPTLEQLAFGRVSAPVDGLSLVPYLEVPERASTLAGRIRFTETCFNTVKLMEGKVTASGVAQEAAAYFEIEPRSGWVQLRQDRLGEIMAHKQRAALSGDAILAAIPSWTDDSVTYLYSSRQTPLPRSLSMPPDPKRDPEASRLWGALVQRFPGELETAAVAP